MIRDADSGKQKVIEWIDYILERKQWTGTDLARRAGLAPSTILRFLNDPDHRFVPSLKTLRKISEGSGYPIPRELLDAFEVRSIDEPKTSVPQPQAHPARHQPGPSLAPKRHLTKVRHVSSLPKSLQPASREEVTVPCPAQLEGDETVFAFYMPEGTYEPWIRAGALCFATRRRDPSAGDMILVTKQDGRSSVRLMLDINENGLVMSKSHPPKEAERLGFDDISELAIVAMVMHI